MPSKRNALKPRDNWIQGKQFEDTFERIARHSGILPIRNHLTGRYTGRRVQLFRSNLDFTLHTRDGRTAYVDCKTFQSGFFTSSDISEVQLERAVLYNDWGVPAGFVVYLGDQTRDVAFFPGYFLKKAGKRKRFDAENCPCYLGKLERMELRFLFEKKFLELEDL